MTYKNIITNSTQINKRLTTLIKNYIKKLPISDIYILIRKKKF